MLRPWAAPIGWLLLLQGIAGLLYFLDWGQGVARGSILAALLALLVLLRFLPVAPFGLAGRAAFPTWLRALLILGLAVDAGAAGYATWLSHRNYDIPLDEGRTTWTAAELLRQGENPYATGALVDRVGYLLRLPERTAAGIGPVLPPFVLNDAFRRYERTLDPALRHELLPVAADSRPTGAAARELRLLGYKYGPVIPILSAPIVWLGLEPLMVTLNAAICFALLAAMWAILRRVAGSRTGLAGLGLVALLFDIHIVWNYMEYTATDVWSLLFCALAVLCLRTQRPGMMAVALAAALGCKIFPGLLLVPFLLRWRSPRPVAIFVAALAIIYGPWLIWDAPGLVDNAFLWPLYMANDDTSWLYQTAPAVAVGARVAAFLVISLLVLRALLGYETRLFWTLAVSNIVLILSGPVLHNNYIPWASIWWVAAVVEAFARGPEPRESRRAAA